MKLPCGARGFDCFGFRAVRLGGLGGFRVLRGLGLCKKGLGV